MHQCLHSASSSPSKARPRWEIVRGFTAAVAPQRRRRGPWAVRPPTWLCKSTSTVNYSTGAVTITFAKAPAAGASITVNYVYGGWMAGGTGLMDEDGSHTAWVGTNPFCLEGPDPNYPTLFLLRWHRRKQPCTQREFGFGCGPR